MSTPSCCHFACMLNPFPLLSAHIVMSSRQGVLLLQCLILPGTTVSCVKKPLDGVKYFWQVIQFHSLSQYLNLLSLLPLTHSKEVALLVGLRGEFLAPPCCHSSTANPSSALGLTAHHAPLQAQGSPFPWHVCSSLLVIASTGMAIVPVGKEGWEGQKSWR